MAFLLPLALSCTRRASGTDGQQAPATVTIASFNLQVFGPSKAGNPAVLAIVAEIIRRFDIVAVQEIRDSTGEAVVTHKAAVNSTGASYAYVIGPREGRTSSKEQYAFFYNTATIEVLPGAYVFDESGTDTFEREPYVARFQVGNAAFDFALVDIHTKPDDATAEISFLPTVIQNAVARTSEPDIICLGDFNADGSYFDETTYASVFPATTYRWLFDNTLDTTVAPSSHTYDHMVTLSATDEDFTGQVGVFRFDEALSLGSIAATDVSDHYPNWAEFWSGRDSDQ